MKEKKFKFELTEEQLAVIEAGLKELPGKICLPILSDLIRQMSEQNAPIPEEKENKNKTTKK